MKKVVIHKAGGYEQLKIEEHADPQPREGEVLVRTEAVGVNYADVCVRWGVYESAKRFVGWPITPGFEFAGRVEQVGAGVTRFQPGDRVFGVSFFTGYSTHVVVPERRLFKMPSQLTMEQAGGFPAVFLTAYHAMFQLARTRPGMTVLVHSAAGGVGSSLVQLGKIAGFKVVGVVGSSHKVDFVKKLGADVVIDKSREDLWTAAEKAAPEGFHFVYDANGHETLRQGYKHLRATGKLITYGFHTMLPKQGGRMNYLKAAAGLLRIPRFDPMKLVMENKGVIGFNLSFLFDLDEMFQEGMRDLTAWVEAGKIHAPQVTTFPLEKVADAHRLIESGQSVGKIVLLTAGK